MQNLLEGEEGGSPGSGVLAAEEAAQQEYLRWRDLRIPSEFDRVWGFACCQSVCGTSRHVSVT